MKCYNCGQEMNDDVSYCTSCGVALKQNNTTTEEMVDNQSGAYANCAPALQLPTNRSLLKMIFLSLITFGIYGMVIYTHISEEINIVASRADGKRTKNYWLMLMLTSVTFGIYALVWQHGFSERIGNELKRRGYDYKFGASSFWLWNVLGSFIIIGPFVYCHKLMKAMNMINASYNYYG